MSSNETRRTPYDDSYGTCERTDAKLRIYSGAMVPEEVTNRLKIKPTWTQTVGETFRNSLERERIASINGWFLSSEGMVSSLDLRRHLDWLLERLIPAKQELLELQKLSGVSMDISCIWWSAYGHGGPILWPEQMSRMSELNLECGFDLYFYGDED